MTCEMRSTLSALMARHSRVTLLGMPFLDTPLSESSQVPLALLEYSVEIIPTGETYRHMQRSSVSAIAQRGEEQAGSRMKWQNEEVDLPSRGATRRCSDEGRAEGVGG